MVGCYNPFTKHHVPFKGPVRFHSYGSPYHVFVLENLENEVIIYDPIAKKVLLHEEYPKYGFTSMVTHNSDVYIGLTTGMMLVLLEDRKSYSYKEFELWELGRCDKGFERQPLGVLGVNELVTFIGTEGRRIGEWQCIYLYIGNSEYEFKLDGSLECYRFDQQSGLLLVVVKTGTKRCLYRIELIGPTGSKGPRCVIYHLEFLPEDCSTHRATAVSINGDVAFHDRGLVYIVNPIQERGTGPLFMENILKADQGGQTCFVGEDDGFLIYCENWSSTIAVAERSGESWKKRDLPRLNISNTLNTRPKGMTYSNIFDPVWNGQKLVVRVGPDGFPGDMGDGEAGNMLLACDLSSRDAVLDEVDLSLSP